MGAAQGKRPVMGVNGSSAGRTDQGGIPIHKELGLSAAGDAALRTGHDLDEMQVQRACLELLNDGLDMLQTGDDADAQLQIAHVHLSGTEPVRAAGGGDVDGGNFFAGDKLVPRSQGCLHDAAGCAEEGTGTGVFTQRGVKGLVGQSGEGDARFFDQPGQFPGGDDHVHVPISRGVHLWALAFKFLAGAGHDGDGDNLFRGDAQAVGRVGFKQCSRHLLGGFAAGEVLGQVGVVALQPGDPCGTA